MDREALRARLIERINASIDEKTTTACDLETCYLEAGTGPPVLLLHGASAAAGIGWYPVVGPLSRAFRVIVPDCPGHGESAKPAATYSEDFFLDWLAAFLDTLDVPAASVVGISQGGAIALKFALRAPDRVERLALVDSAGLTPWLPIGFVFGLIWGNLFPSDAARRWVMRYVVTDPDTVVEDPDATLDGLTDLLAYGSTVAGGPNGRRVIWRGRGRVTRALSKAQLRKIQPPTLLIWGEQDRIFPVDVARKAARTIPRARLYVIPGAAHIPFFEQREAFLGALVPFLLGDLRI